MEAVIVTSDAQIRRIVAEALHAALPGALSRLNPAHAGAKEWYTEPEAKAFLGWSKATMQRRRNDGTLPHSKIGGSLFYLHVDLLRVLEEHRVTKATARRGMSSGRAKRTSTPQNLKTSKLQELKT